MKPHISVLTPCFNEAGNVDALYTRIRAVFDKLPEYSYEQVFIDNASTDDTLARLKELAARDKNVKIIVNTRNFGHIRSPYYALLQCRGDAVVAMASDLQDPPELIPEFLAKWRQGFKVVLGVKAASKESPVMFAVPRRCARSSATSSRRRAGATTARRRPPVSSTNSCAAPPLYREGLSSNDWGCN